MCPADLGELRGICRDIVRAAKTKEVWRAEESCDEFQTKHFVGGFDATEDAFCFSYFSPEGERWFQFTLDEAGALAAGESVALSFRVPQ